jgi:hypothetical protein
LGKVGFHLLRGHRRGTLRIKNHKSWDHGTMGWRGQERETELLFVIKTETK